MIRSLRNLEERFNQKARLCFCVKADSNGSRSAISTIATATIVVIIVVAIGLVAVLQIPAKNSSTQSSTRSSGEVSMQFVYPGTLVASSDLSWMNYSLTFTSNGPVLSNLSLSVLAPTGLLAQFSQNTIAVDASPSSATLQIGALQSTVPGNYQIMLIATDGGSTYSENETVQVLKYLVVTIGTSFVPGNLTVMVGGSVTWIRLNGNLSQYDNGDHDVDFSSGISTVSPTLAQYESWNYTFSQIGNYDYYCKYHPFMTGEIRVVSG